MKTLSKCHELLSHDFLCRTGGAAVAQRAKLWPADLAVPGSSPA